MEGTFPAALILILFAAGQQAPQTPPRDTPPPGAATASVSGRVTDKETGKPLRGFRVVVSRRTTSEYRSFETETDEEGRFTISGLAPGEYYAMASPGEFRAGHLGRSFGASDTPRSPFDAPSAFELKPGESKQDIDFALERTFAIEGRVVNEYGEGLADIEVSGERADARFGGTTNVTTDDRGQFRVYNVARGAWRLCAKPGNVWPGTPTGGDALDVRFVKTCFPPAGGPGAITVTTSDLGGVLITMQRDRGYSIAGHVIDQTGAPVRGASIGVERLEPGGSYSSLSISPEVSGSSFVARGLTPGEYLVRATVQEPFDPYAPRPRAYGPREMAVTKVRIDGSDLTGVALTTSPGVDVAGRLRFDGVSNPPPSPARFQMGAQRTRDDQQMYQGMMTPTSPVNDDWSFELRRLYGPVVVSAYDTSREWVVQSVRYGGADITDLPVEFKGGSDARPLEVTLTNRLARVTARPISADGKPATDAVVLMLPADPARRKLRFVVPQAPGKDGRAVMPPRPPGEYLIVALPAEDAVRLMRTLDDLEGLAARGQRVSLEAGDHALDVKVVKVYEGR